MIFFALRFNESAIKSNMTFAIIVLFISTLLAFVASVDHTELCIQAIAVIVYWIALIVHGMYYMHNQRLLILTPPKKYTTTDMVNLIIMYVKLICIGIFDWFYYGYPQKEWFLLCCFISFLEPINKNVKYFFYASYLFFLTIGFAVDVDRSFYYWMLYLAFVLTLGFLNTLELKEKWTDL